MATKRNLSQSSLLDINRLPQELMWMILEYYVQLPQDLIRFACVCRDWREISLSSVLWCRREMKHFHGHYQSLTLNQRCLLDEPKQISLWYIEQLNHFYHEINDPNSLVRRDERSHDRRTLLVNVTIGFVVLLVIVIGVCFGINWSNQLATICSTLGFISAYLLLTIALIAVLLNDQSLTPELRHRLQHRGEPRFVQKMTTLLCLFLSISLSHYKLMTHSSIHWVDILIPLCFVVVTITIDYWKNVHSTTQPHLLSWRDTLKTLLVPFLLMVPPLLALFLYCYYVDYHQQHLTSRVTSPYSPAFCLVPLSPHLLYLGWYFISSISKSALSLCCEQGTIWDAFLSLQLRALHVLIRVMAITSGALGIVSLILFALFAFPSRPSSLLFTQVNAIFYLLLIFISWLVTRSGQVALGSTLLQIFHVSDVLSIGFGR
jgi:hypothetical protein